jgi:hypothetical protein
MKSVARFVFALGLSTLLLPNGNALAQSSSTASVNTETSVIPSISAPKFGDFTPTAAVRSTNDSGRFGDYGDPKAKEYRLKNEYFVGASHASGWGIMGTAVTKGYATQTDSTYGPGDASVILTHPAFYSDETTKVWGAFRRYFALSNWSKDHNVEQYAYYLFTTHKMGKGVELFNAFSARAFNVANNDGKDSPSSFDDLTHISQKMNSWLRLGVGQHITFENHYRDPSGTYMEMYPFAKFILSSNIFIEPRLLLPLYKQNYVFDTPKTVALINSQAELFVNIAL